MMDLLGRLDPARDLVTDADRLRAKVDERLELSTQLRPRSSRRRRPWVVALGAMVAVVAFTVPLAIRFGGTSLFDSAVDGVLDFPGFDSAVPLASGGVQTMASDGDTIWVVTALQHELQKVSASSGELEAKFSIGAYVEGVVVGADKLWLMSYDNGGEVLRFDPDLGSVDLTIPIDGAPGLGATWQGNHLWVSNEMGDLFQISAEGEIVTRARGDLKGSGLGYAWVNNPDTGLIESLDPDGFRGEVTIPTFEGLETMAGPGVRKVAEAGGYLWLLDGDFPWGTNLSRFDPVTRRLDSFGGVTFGLLDLIEFDGYLWVTSNTDHMLIRVDPVTDDLVRYPLPGKAGGLLVADGSLWLSIYQPGILARLEPEKLTEAQPVVFDNWDLYPHRLICTGDAVPGRPTIILESPDWIEYGSWSVIQAELSLQGLVVCANGYLDEPRTPQERASELAETLQTAGLAGPYVVVAAGDGVHSARLFVAGTDDVAGIVLVDPVPLGFNSRHDELLPDFGHPPWLDIDPAISVAAGDFGDTPLIVIGHDPNAGFLQGAFVASVGKSVAVSLNQTWQEGLEFYGGLSTDGAISVAPGTNMDNVVRNSSAVIVRAVLELAGIAE